VKTGIDWLVPAEKASEATRINDKTTQVIFSMFILPVLSRRFQSVGWVERSETQHI
jgi:hypothetical protein